MPTLKVTVNVELDARSLPGFPVIRRLEVDEAQQFQYEKVDDTDGTTFVAIPTGEIAALQAFILETDQQVTIRLDAQTDQGIVLNAGGLLIIMDATIDSGATTNAKINRNGSTTANIKGIGAGT